MNHSFVSSSTVEGSMPHDAARAFGNEQHSQLLRQAEHHGVVADPAVNHWQGVREGVHLRGSNAPDAGVKLGRQFGQSHVLHFSETKDGPDCMYHFQTTQPSKVAGLSPLMTVSRNGTFVMAEEPGPDFHAKAVATGVPFTESKGKVFFKDLSND